MKILLVDDSDMMLQYIGALLSAAGHVVVARKSLVDAVDAYSRERPNAVLSDFVLERATGLECLAAIFAIAGPHRPPAAILTQGQLLMSDQIKSESLGIEILQKPIRGREQEFLSRIAGWLGNSKN